VAARARVVVRLLDADVLVDIIRGYLPAIRWLTTLNAEITGIPGPVAMEVIEGCRNLQEARRVERIIRRFPVYWPTPDDGNRALRDFAVYRLAHNLSAVDALVAECAIAIGATLVTFNVKHFRVFADLKTEQPYQR
jgi:predicted nucleic acid-binding protein